MALLSKAVCNTEGKLWMRVYGGTLQTGAPVESFHLAPSLTSRMMLDLDSTAAWSS